MGSIHREVEVHHLRDYPHETPLLFPFLHSFDITWASRRRLNSTELSFYFLSPLQNASDQFGLTTEVMLAISDSRTLQPRVIQAVERCLAEEPAHGRVNQSLFFLITAAENAVDFLREYTANNSQARIPVLFARDTLSGEVNSWFVRNVIAGQLFSRDLFDNKLPLRSDLAFFGRDAIVADFIDAARRSENRGLFGLRKTGKTSVLRKVMRLAATPGDVMLFYDCKRVEIRSLTWEQLLERIIGDILQACSRSMPRELASAHVGDRFSAAIRLVRKRNRITLIFDEIEYISPKTCLLDPHWNLDFIHFWQTLWAMQSEYGRLSYFVAGVNSTVVETDVYSGIQNPMFGIVTSVYLTGFTEPELKTMLEYFGHRMGLRFTPDSITYLLERYGGHPLLTRMACSHANAEVSIRGAERPIRLAKHFLVETEAAREQELSFYCGHIISEIRDYYSDEYEMLTMLATGNIADFSELAAEPQYIRHLKGYGLIELKRGQRPAFRIPVLQKYIAAELARREKRPFERYVIPADARTEWLRQRIQKIQQDLRDLERLISRNSLLTLYGRGGMYEAEQFHGLAPVGTANEFAHFINVCSRCLVEPFKDRQAPGKRSNYLEAVRADYPEFWSSLERIRLYRNNTFHIELRENADESLRSYLAGDIGDRRPAQVPEFHFVLQQSVIDGIFMGIRCEIDRVG